MYIKWHEQSLTNHQWASSWVAGHTQMPPVLPWHCPCFLSEHSLHCYKYDGNFLQSQWPVCVHVCVCVCTCVCACMCVCACVCACECACVCACECACYVGKCVWTCFVQRQLRYSMTPTSYMHTLLRSTPPPSQAIPTPITLTIHFSTSCHAHLHCTDHAHLYLRPRPPQLRWPRPPQATPTP